jgi:hypothetical protein
MNPDPYSRSECCGANLIIINSFRDIDKKVWYIRKCEECDKEYLGCEK